MCHYKAYIGTCNHTFIQLVPCGQHHHHPSKPTKIPNRDGSEPSPDKCQKCRGDRGHENTPVTQSDRTSSSDGSDQPTAGIGSKGSGQGGQGNRTAQGSSKDHPFSDSGSEGGVGVPSGAQRDIRAGSHSEGSSSDSSFGGVQVREDMLKKKEE